MQTRSSRRRYFYSTSFIIASNPLYVIAVEAPQRASSFSNATPQQCSSLSAVYHVELSCKLSRRYTSL